MDNYFKKWILYIRLCQSHEKYLTAIKNDKLPSPPNSAIMVL